MPDRIPAGRLGRPHGVRGEVTVLPSDPSLFAPGAELHGEDGQILTVRSVRPYRDRGLVVGFTGFADRSAAETLRGVVVSAAAGDVADPAPGEWWIDDLIGLEAVTADGTPLGTLVDVVAGAQDRLVVATPAGGRVEVPFVADLVDEPEGGEIVMRPPEGLFE